MSTDTKTLTIFEKFLVKKKTIIIQDKALLKKAAKIRGLLSDLEDTELQMRSTDAAKRLSKMTEEQRRMSLMRPEEKRFFLEYKAKNPANPWGYTKAYQKKLQEAYNKTGKLVI